MSKWLKYIVLLGVILFAAEQVNAQFYSWGADPARFKWKKITSERSTVIYPQHVEQIGLATHSLTEVLKPSIAYGFELPPLDLPFIVHPENMRSNGLVMWLPKRVEFLSSPTIDGYSMPWLKQLTAHEYRHAAQYYNINVGFIKFLSYLLGEQSSTIGLVFMPLWMIEGDATDFETQVSTFGRARQPRFTLEFRAMGNIADKYRNPDKFFCGSYRDFIPDHYQMGYQMVSYGNKMMGRVMANEMASYGPRHPWTIVSTSWRMNKLFGLSEHGLFDKTFRDLVSYWESLPKVEDTASRLPAPRFSSYTKYSNPIWLSQSSVIALKQTLDEPQHIIMLDADTGFEQRLAYTGDVSTRPIYDAKNRRLWWTEYRRGLIFQEKVISQLCYMDLDGKRAMRPRTVKRNSKNILYPTVTDEGRMAWVEYAPQGIYSFREQRGEGEDMVVSLPFGEEIHSLTWDNLTRRYYIIVTGDEGMWLSQIDDKGEVKAITKPAYITLSKLRAEDGKLYYGSIASGRDEVHCLDLVSGKEYQLTESAYGSFDAAPTGDGGVVMVTYDSLGYHPALQRSGKFVREVEHSRLPREILNPPRTKWEVLNLDTVRMADMVREPSDTSRNVKVKRYRKGLHLFNLHSWAPLSYDPFGLTDEGAVNFNLGATVMTQNLLSSLQGFFSYGYSQSAGHFFKTSLRYYGLGPTISLNATYGGRQNIYPIYTYNPEKHEIELPEAPSRGKFYSVGLDVQFPLLFQRGYHTRYLIASAGWEYSNGLVANTGKLSFDDGGISNIATIGYSKGIHLTSFTLGFQDMVRQAHRDFAPPWGVVASATYATNPANGAFSDLLALYAKVYTPGFVRHNSLTLAMAYQTSFGGFESDDALSALSFKSARLLPRGFNLTQIENQNYLATSLNYQLPICYPDGGWRGVVYFKRIRLNAGFDYAQFERRRFHEDGALHREWQQINSWGGDIILDCNFLGQPASATTALKLSLYKPSEGSLYFAAGVELPF